MYYNVPGTDNSTPLASLSNGDASDASDGPGVVAEGSYYKKKFCPYNSAIQPRKTADGTRAGAASTYAQFLASKRATSSPAGIEVALDDIHPMLFEFQRVIVQWALRKGRAAIFADTGLGKTLISVECARLAGQRTLILAPLSVARQTVNEARKIGVDVHYTRTGHDLHQINITNYEMLEHFNPDDFGMVILDESSILKSMASKTRDMLIEKFADTPYRLAFTATPAPNDITEIANHAEFLGIMTRVEMLAMYFIHDSDTTAHGGWRLKGHATDAFYRWMASWSMSVKKPSDIGFSDEGYNLPPLHTEPIVVRTEYSPDDQLFFTGLKGVGDRSKARRGTIGDRVQCAVDLVNRDKLACYYDIQSSTDAQKGDKPAQWILWCGMNDESSALARMIPDAIEITGSDNPDKKIAAIEAFQSGKYRVLVTKPSIAGFGINLQNCHNMAFVGIGDSFESYYQCIRRCYRFGQQSPVNAYIILSDIEQEIYQNVQRKEEEAATMSQQLIQHVQQFERDEIAQVERQWDYSEDTIVNEHYKLMLGDSCERIAEIPADSVDLSVFSPPFQSLYTYSPTERDLGNSRTAEEFYEHFNYIIDGLLRITKPGRNCCVHVQQIAASLIHDGFIGLKDFRGDVIRAFSARGWVYYGEVCIDKNPQVQAIRSHAKGLAFAQKNKDSSWSRPAFADYILLFRKPGDNAVPVKTDITNEEWIEWARPVWYGIRETETLNATEGRDEKDERHVCPLQLGTIERCVRLWSNPGETVFSPFTGIGSEGYESIRNGRKFIGIELKESYFRTARKNLDRIIRQKTQTTLFDFADEQEEAEVIA